MRRPSATATVSGESDQAVAATNRPTSRHRIMFRVDGSALYNLINERPTALLIVDAREPDVFAAGVFAESRVSWYSCYIRLFAAQRI
jgi:hypothetical protein